MDLNPVPSTGSRILAAKREWRDAIKRYGRGDVVTREYERQLREFVALVIGGEL